MFIISRAKHFSFDWDYLCMRKKKVFFSNKDNNRLVEVNFRNKCGKKNANFNSNQKITFTLSARVNHTVTTTQSSLFTNPDYRRVANSLEWVHMGVTKSGLLWGRISRLLLLFSAVFEWRGHLITCLYNSLLYTTCYRKSGSQRSIVIFKYWVEKYVL